MVHDRAVHGQPSPPHSNDGEYTHRQHVQLASAQLFTPPHTYPYQTNHVHSSEYPLPISHRYYDSYQASPVSPAKEEGGLSSQYYEQVDSTQQLSPVKAESGIQTRSGRKLQHLPSPPAVAADSSPMPVSRRSRSPKPRKSRAAANRKKDDRPLLSEPLSIMTKDFKIPILDIEAFVNRSSEERRAECEQKHKGKIPRPMNSFMLYRFAFKERIKKWGQQGDNNQLISRVAGISWPLEPHELRDFFARCAILERDNHSHAFPNYKFSPNKTPKKRSRDNNADDDNEVGSDPDWEAPSRGVRGASAKRSRRDAESEVPRSMSSTPFYGTSASGSMYPSPQLQYPIHHQHLSSAYPIGSNPYGMPSLMTMDQWGHPHPAQVQQLHHRYQQHQRQQQQQQQQQGVYPSIESLHESVPYRTCRSDANGDNGMSCRVDASESTGTTFNSSYTATALGLNKEDDLLGSQVYPLGTMFSEIPLDPELVDFDTPSTGVNYTYGYQYGGGQSSGHGNGHGTAVSSSTTHSLPHRPQGSNQRREGVSSSGTNFGADSVGAGAYMHPGSRMLTGPGVGGLGMGTGYGMEVAWPSSAGGLYAGADFEDELRRFETMS